MRVDELGSRAVFEAIVAHLEALGLPYRHLHHAPTRTSEESALARGEPILPLPLHVDRSVLANDRIAFNAGLLTDSIIMATADWRRAVTIEQIVEVSAQP